MSFLILSCVIFSALMLQGGQLSLSLQLVKIALFTTVLFSSLFEDEPYILGSWFISPNTSLCILILVSLDIWLLSLKLKKPSEK